MKGQRWNPGAVFHSTRHLLWKRNYFLPHYRVPDIRAINFELLKQTGIKAIIFDKDNTITAPYVDHIFPTIAAAFAKCVSIFGKEGIVVFSNSAGSIDDKGYNKAMEIERLLGVPVLRHQSKKPEGMEDVKKHFEGRLDGKEIAMVGDRYATDILFGNLHGMLTIHTDPLTAEGELAIVRTMRFLEDHYVSFLSNSQKLQPPPHPLYRPDLCTIAT